MPIDLIGFIAAILTTGAFIPQVAKTITTKDTSGISLSMYIIFVTGIFLWLIYGLLIESTPIILSNIVTGLLSSIILFYKFKATIQDKNEKTNL